MPRTGWDLPKQGILSQAGKQAIVSTRYDPQPSGASESAPILGLFSGGKTGKGDRENTEKNWLSFQGRYGDGYRLRVPSLASRISTVNAHRVCYSPHSIAPAGKAPRLLPWNGKWYGLTVKRPALHFSMLLVGGCGKKLSLGESKAIVHA